MRVTNMMMTTNMLNNITRNKSDMNTKFNQYATGQKIQKPSEDPVVAIRSLKYRSNLSELKQYLDKNIQDAYSWMNITESALTNMDELLTNMYQYCTQGSQDTYENINRDTIQQTMQQYKEQIYKCINTDYAGRYVFSGYRTDTSVCYTEKTNNIEYEINEDLTFENLFQKSYVLGGATYAEGTTSDEYLSQAPTVCEAYCMNLSYNNINALTGLTYTDADGNVVDLSNVIDVVTSSDTSGANTEAGEKFSPYNVKDGRITFIKDTGEIIVSADIYKKLSQSKYISTTYTKNEFDTQDIRPEMYYDCKAYELEVDNTGEVKRDGDGKLIRKAQEPKVYVAPESQDVYYEVNFGQKLKVNTMANEVLNSSLARSMDDILNAINAAYDTQQDIDNVELLLENNSLLDSERENLTTLKEQLKTELVLRKSLVQEAFTNGMVAIKNTQDGTKVVNEEGSVKKISVNIALTSLGSRYTRLQLIEERLTEQETSFTEIMSNNECVDLEEAIINYIAAEQTYTASLSAASKVVQNSLLDFL